MGLISPLKNYISCFRLQDLQILNDAESASDSSALQGFLLAMRIALVFSTDW